MKFYLNSEFFSYDENLNLDKRRTAILYDMFVRLRTSYQISINFYQISNERIETLFRTDSFRNLFPLVIIDC